MDQETGKLTCASRRFVHAIGPISSILIISTDVASMIVPSTMGLLIPVLGINWVMVIPAQWLRAHFPADGAG